MCVEQSFCRPQGVPEQEAADLPYRDPVASGSAGVGLLSSNAASIADQGRAANGGSWALLPYLVAVLTVLAATLVKYGLDGWVGPEAPFLFFFGAVIVSSLTGGLGPGLLATGLSAMIAGAFLIDVNHSADEGVGLRPSLYLALFLGEAVLICWLIASLLQARRRAEQLTATERAALTREQEAHAATRAAEQRCREVNRGKDEFLAMLSHELRNPLASLNNALYLLHSADLSDPTACEVRDLIDRQVRKLAAIITNLLDAFRLARNQAELLLCALDLGAVVRLTVADRRATFKDAGLDLQVKAPADPVWVDGDRARLVQVLTNLLQNAAKFTPAGGQVHVSLVVDGGTRRAQVTVRDTGAGLAPEVLPRLFETFAQAPQGLDRGKGGLGLGLALVKGLVELHGGGVAASSAGQGQGTEIRFWLPLGQPPAVPETGAATSVAAPMVRLGTKMLRILIVEDNFDTARTLQTLLRYYGHDVTAAHTGPAGLAAARSLRPDVVLCDLGLPDLDGFEVARALRADPETAAARLIAVSGYGQEEDRRQSARAGFELHLTKPVDPAELQRLLAEGVTKSE